MGRLIKEALYPYRTREHTPQWKLPAPVSRYREACPGEIKAELRRTENWFNESAFIPVGSEVCANISGHLEKLKKAEGRTCDRNPFPSYCLCICRESPCPT